MKKVFIYTFKVKLKFAKRIWRRIDIRSDQTLKNLHDIIFTAFDRYDEHLYTFYDTKIPIQFLEIDYIMFLNIQIHQE